MPRAAAEEAREAILLKTQLHRLKDEFFSEVPARLKRVLGRLIDAPGDEIILGNSASYSLHLLANGIRWQPGDEVLLIKDDFPANILPWLALEKRGVRIRLIEPREQVLQAEELESYVTKSTKLLCLTLVHSFNGYTVDVHALGEVCRAHGVTFVLNCSQALGTRAFSISTAPVDAVVSVGFKWLCGPYGTGFCWLRRELLESLEYNQAYWLSVLTAEDLSKERIEYQVPNALGARQYDVFGTANFLNFKPWAAAVEYLLEQGIERIEERNDSLVSRLIAGVNRKTYDLLSPRTGEARSTLVFISHKQTSRNANIYEALTQNGVHVALRSDKLRFSPHLYNTEQEIDYALSVLESAS
jgi:selenocysteine lyase/cysteine desulfurase